MGEISAACNRNRAFKKIENFIGVAPKLTTGNLEFCLWVDENGALYVQIVRNLTNTKKPGTFAKSLFSVSGKQWCQACSYATRPIIAQLQT